MEEDLPKVQNSASKKFDSFRSSLARIPKRWIPPILILLAIPLTLALSYVNTNYLSHAGGAPFASVEVNPGIVNVKIGDSKEMSALAFDSQHNPMVDGVNYSWSMSSNNSVATLSKTDGNISTLTGLKSGCGELTVMGTNNGVNIPRTVHVVVFDGVTAPACAHNSIQWLTPDVELNASEFKITVNGKEYHSDPATLQLHSDGSYNAENSNTTTMEAIWQENGVEMRMNFYYEVDKATRHWKITEIRTYDGNANGEWVYYKGMDGSNVGGDIYVPYLTINSDPDNPNNHTQGSIYFQDFLTTPFLRYDYTQPVPTTTPMPTPSTYPTPTPLPIHNPITWNASNVDLTADNYYIHLSGNNYVGVAPIDLHSDEGNSHYTTLESIWHENGVEMRMFMYFRLLPKVSTNSPDRWEMYDLRTYNGSSQGDWLYYHPVDSSGNNLKGNIGTTTSFGNLDFLDQSGYSSIHFENLKLNPFKHFSSGQPTPTVMHNSSGKVTFNPVADAFIRSDTPNQNYGTITGLLSGAGPRRVTLIKFDLSSLKGKKIQKMTLKINVPNVAGAASNDVQNIEQVVNSSWQEGRVTYNNRPIIWGSFKTFKANRLNSSYSIDITNPSIIANLQNSSQFSIGIEGTGTDNLLIYSRESSVGKPQLIVDYQ